MRSKKIRSRVKVRRNNSSKKTIRRKYGKRKSVKRKHIRRIYKGGGRTEPQQSTLNEFKRLLHYTPKGVLEPRPYVILDYKLSDMEKGGNNTKCGNCLVEFGFRNWKYSCISCKKFFCWGCVTESEYIPLRVNTDKYISNQIDTHDLDEKMSTYKPSGLLHPNKPFCDKCYKHAISLAYWFDHRYKLGILTYYGGSWSIKNSQNERLPPWVTDLSKPENVEDIVSYEMDTMPETKTDTGTVNKDHT